MAQGKVEGEVACARDVILAAKPGPPAVEDLVTLARDLAPQLADRVAQAARRSLCLERDGRWLSAWGLEHRCWGPP